MHSFQIDVDQLVDSREASLAIVKACTVEIRAHLVIFTVVFFPTVALLLPSLFTALAIYISGNSVARLATRLDFVGKVVSSNWASLSVACGIILTIVAVLKGRRAFQTVCSADGPSPELTQSPRGVKGEILVQRLTSIWQRLPTAARPAPTVLWYSNFNVLAHAFESGAGQLIEVSSGLWERVVKGDPVADAILTHEAAHLVFRDPTVFRGIAIVATTVRMLLHLVTAISVGAVVVVMSSQLVLDIAARLTLLEVVRNAIGILTISALSLLELPLSRMLIRRYAGFIVSLIEVRADVAAALWTVGLVRFAEALANDPTLRRSELKDLRRSLFSLDLTHISETERVNLLRSTDRLITPKLRYFALSIALPFLFPVNAVTYLIYGGAIDHLLITVVVVVFQVTAMAMIQSGSVAAVLSWRRAVLLGTALCLVQALPLINLAPIGYLFTHYAVAIVNGSGFGIEPISFLQVIDDSRVTAVDIFSKCVDATDGLSFGYALAVTSIAIRGMSSLARGHRSRRTNLASLVLPVSCAGVASIYSSYDPWRAEFFSSLPFSTFGIWFTWTTAMPWLRLCVPTVVALIVLVLQSAAWEFAKSRR
jgi:Zn-dependent protease with chaperone function